MSDLPLPFSQFVYKICASALWRHALETGSFIGAPIDIKDGFIHFSTDHQMKQTAEKHFSGQADLKLLQVDITDLEIVWEVSRGGQPFPHLYDVLPLSAIVNVWDLPLDRDGAHRFPDISSDQVRHIDRLSRNGGLNEC